MGHTTCCFLSVEGGSENEKYFMTEEGKERYPIGDLNDVGHAQSKGNSKLKEMGQDSLLRVFYPKSASKLLQNDVVLVDRWDYIQHILTANLVPVLICRLRSMRGSINIVQVRFVK